MRFAWSANASRLGLVWFRAGSGQAGVDQALHGGEDYELLFTVAPDTKVPAAFEGLPLTRIGSIRSGVAGRVFLDGAQLEPLGYDHFRRRMKT